MKKPEEDT
jgi:hypothetical protein